MEALEEKFHYWASACQKWRFQAQNRVDHEHFWEINGQTIFAEKIEEVARNCSLSTRNTFRNPHFVCHRFFVFEKARA